MIGDVERCAAADSYESKYGAHFTAPSGTWFGLGDAIRRGDALVYRVAPARAFGFAKGKPFSQTRWTFSETPAVRATTEARPLRK